MSKVAVIKDEDRDQTTVYEAIPNDVDIRVLSRSIHAMEVISQEVSSCKRLNTAEFEEVDENGPPYLKYTNLPSLATDEAAVSPPKGKVFGKAIESKTQLVEESKYEDEMGRTMEQFTPANPLMTKSVERNALAFNLNSPEASIADFDNHEGQNEEIAKSITQELGK